MKPPAKASGISAPNADPTPNPIAAPTTSELTSIIPAKAASRGPVKVNLIV
jgi:hypothetical protein